MEIFENARRKIDFQPVFGYLRRNFFYCLKGAIVTLERPITSFLKNIFLKQNLKKSQKHKNSHKSGGHHGGQRQVTTTEKQ